MVVIHNKDYPIDILILDLSYDYFCTKKKMDVIPSEIKLLTQLIYINLIENKIIKIPQEIQYLTNEFSLRKSNTIDQ